MASHPHEPHRARREPSEVQVIGILLLVPLTIVWLIGQVLPTLATVGLSLMETTALTDRSRFTGLTNYGSILSDHQFAASLRFTLLGVLALVVAVAILPPLLAAAAVSFSPAVRLPLRLLFSLPLAMASPIAIAITLGGLSRADLSDPGTAAATLIRTEALYAFLIACAIGLIAYVAALRTRPTGEP